jgi:hypothetical protein
MSIARQYGLNGQAGNKPATVAKPVATPVVTRNQMDGYVTMEQHGELLHVVTQLVTRVTQLEAMLKATLLATGQPIDKPKPKRDRAAEMRERRRRKRETAE